MMSSQPYGDEAQHQPLEDDAADHEGLDRSGFLKVTTAGAVGFIAGQVGASRVAGGQSNTDVRATAAAAACQAGNLSILPSKAGARYLKQTLLRDARFRVLYDQFTDRGFRFVPERVQLSVGVLARDTSGDVSLPFLLAIVPSFRRFSRKAKSHQAVSIVSFQDRRVSGLLAGTVTVRHKPFQIASLGIIEIDPTGKLVSRKVTRKELETLSPAALAKRLGAPPLDPKQLDKDVGAPSEADVSALARLVYRRLLLDRFASPLYPRAGLRSMLRDAPLTQKFAVAQRKRFADFGGPLQFGDLCSSSSTSSNACTSTSTSSIFLKAA